MEEDDKIEKEKQAEKVKREMVKKLKIQMRMQ